MNFPSDLRYTKDHEWIRLEKDGVTATIGITDFAQSELGDIVYVEIDSMNSDVEHDEIFGTVEAVKTVSELFMPVSGKVSEFNEALEDNPELVNDDPYGEGWIIKITAADPAQIETLLTAAEYGEMVSS